MVKEFLNHEFNINRVVLIKVNCGHGIELHFDLVRNFSINLGLKNSNTCMTHVYSGPLVNKTLINENSKKYTFTMNDGDVYILNTKQAHEVEPIHSITTEENRYLLSYSFD